MENLNEKKIDNLINSLLIQPNDIIDMVDFYYSLPNESLIKDSIGLSIFSIYRFINKGVQK